MKAQAPEDFDIGALIREVRRYLAAVDTFRAEDSEPTWLPEQESVPKRASRGRDVLLGAPPIP